MKKYFEYGSHAVIVLIFITLLNQPSFELTLGVFNSGDGSMLWPSILGTLINAIIFYGTSLYLIPNVLKKRGAGLFTIALILCWVVLSSVEIGIDIGLYSGLRNINATDLTEIVVIVVSFNLLTLIFAFAYRFTKDWFYNEQQRRAINEWQLRTELNLLKSQINPHFLFNALNNLFSMALQNKDETTAEGISKLSEMMRYVFEKSSLDLVLIDDEINYINDYIYLQKLRFAENVTINFDYPKDPKGKVAPMLFVPYVENAFKYGISSSSKTAIDINLVVQDGWVIFTIENQIIQQKENIPSSGIGLKNVAQRLKLLYPDNHHISIKEENGKFKVELKLLVK